MNKDGQVTAIIVFALVVIGILFIAPFIVKLVIVPADKFSSALSNINQSGTNQSVSAVNFIKTKFTSTIDWVIAFFLLFNVMILLISAFLVDIHPAFLIVYIVAVFFLVLFAPTALDALETIYHSTDPSISGFATEVSYLPITSWIVDNFGLFIVGVIMLSGLIMFGKYKLNSQSSGGTPY